MSMKLFSFYVIYRQNIFESSVLKAFTVNCWSMPSINPWSILRWHSINTLVDTQLTLHRQSVDTALTLNRHLSGHLVDRWLIFDQITRDDWYRANYWSTVHQVLIEWQPSIDQDVNYSKYGSRCQWRGLIESIDPHLTMDAFSTHSPYFLVLFS